MEIQGSVEAITALLERAEVTPLGQITDEDLERIVGRLKELDDEPQKVDVAAFQSFI